jgi:hypothetical protein
MAPQAHPPEKGAVIVFIICVLVDGFRSFNDATNERVTSGQSFFAFGGVGGESVSVA